MVGILGNIIVFDIVTTVAVNKIYVSYIYMPHSIFLTVNEDKKLGEKFCNSVLQNGIFLYLSINEEGVFFVSHDLVKIWLTPRKVFRLLPKKI